MAKTPDYLNSLNGWAKVLAAVKSHAADLPYLEQPSSRLAALLEQANGLSTQFSALTAAKQEVRQNLKQVIREGDTLAAFLRTGARERFGSRSEKMVEFGLQPFRGRKAAKPPEKPDPEEKTASPASTPTSKPDK